MIMNRQLRRIFIIFMLIVSIQILYGLNTTVEAAQSHSIYDVQEKLTEKGYDPGQIDGIMGIKTIQAIKQFQKDNDLSVSATLDIETEKKLFEDGKGNPDHTEDSAISSGSATTMKHSPPDYFVSDHRIQLEAQVEDPTGVKLVRCYFKAVGEADLVFVPMHMTGENEYAGILPAPSAATSQIQYLFLAVNTSKKVVRSQTFIISKDENQETPSWQEIPKEGEIKVSMELDKVPTELRGFSDNVTIDAVESGARFGVVALLYHTIRDSDSSKNAGTSSTSSGTAASSATSSSAVVSATSTTGATSAGMITAGSAATAGLSTAAIVGIGVGAAAVVGGTAAAVSGGGGGGSSSDDSNNNNSGQGEELTEKTIVGFWNVNGSSTSDATTAGDFTYNANETYSYSFQTIFSSGSTSDTSGTGTWTLTGTNLVLTFDAGAVYNGTASGDSDAFTMVSDNGWTLNFRR